MNPPYSIATGLLALLLLGDPSASRWQLLAGGLLAMVNLVALWGVDLRDTRKAV